MFASLLTLVSTLLACPAFAGHYGHVVPPDQPPSSQPIYSGGSYTVDGVSYSDGPQNGGAWGGGWGTARNVSCSGAITATFTWIPDGPGDDPPQSVIVMEQCGASGSAMALGYSPTTSAEADNGLNDVPTPSSNYDPGPPEIRSSGDSSSGTHYRLMAGGLTLPLTCSPSASASADGSPYYIAYAGASVSYKASIDPVTVAWTGVTPDGGALKVLTGQQATATLITPFPPKNGTDGKPMADWTITGNVFKNYDPTKLNKEQYSALKDEDKQKTVSVSLYTKKNNEPVKATCTATLDFPADAILEGGLPIVTAESKILLSIKPDLADGKIRSGKVDKTTANFGYFGYGQSQEGQYWYDVNISVPAPFSGGTGGFAQIITPHRTATRQTDPPYPADVPYPKNDIDGLDTDYPYSFNFTHGAWPLPELQAIGWDSPSQSLEPRYDDGGGTRWVKMVAHDIFKTYIMFKPTDGTSPVWIPMASYDWYWQATCEFLQGGWDLRFVAPGIGANHNWAVTDEHPVWTVKHTYLSTEDLLLPH